MQFMYAEGKRGKESIFTSTSSLRRVINSVASYVIDSLHGNTLSSRSSRPRRDDDSRGGKVDNAEIEFNSTYVRRNYLKTTSNCQIN